MANNLNAFDNMVRVIRNVYNAVFETASIQKRNQPYRMSVTTRSGILVGEIAAGLVQALIARAWGGLILDAGTYSPGGGIISTTQLRTANSLHLGHPSQPTIVDNGWVMLRFTPSWASGAPPYASVYAWSYHVSGLISLTYNGGNWIVNYSGSNVSVAGSHAIGQKVTIIFAWSKTNNFLRIWRDSAAMVAATLPAAGLAISGLATQPSYIGGSASFPTQGLGGTVQLAAWGTGVLTDDMATILKTAEDGADQYEFPLQMEAQLSFLWDGQIIDNPGSVYPLGVVGVSIVAA
jgi:hypothetical protein